MLPLRDSNPGNTVPWVTRILIAANVLVFLVQLGQGGEIHRFNYTWGLVPARYFMEDAWAWFGISGQLISFVSYMFLHGGFLHLLGNMWFLHIFGDNVEDRLGPFRFLTFYLACGLMSAMGHMFFSLDSGIPLIGASGAVAGVMGAYILLYPAARVLTLVPIFFIPLFLEIPAVYLLGYWLLLQFFNAVGSSAEAAGVAWWAHIAGFLFGAALAALIRKVPEQGLDRKIQTQVQRKKTQNFQVIHPRPGEGTADLFGELQISPWEALNGSKKLVNLPWGYHQRFYRVVVPPDSREGRVLRLRGLGRRREDGGEGNLCLSLRIRTCENGARTC